MSIFRPHKSKPRQFNYTPRYYDPRKEALDKRRRELHGTSSAMDDTPYRPGDYLRTQSDARRESRESQSQSASNRLIRYALLIIVVGLGISYLMPRVLGMLERIMAVEQGAEVVATDATMSSDSMSVPRSVVLNEQHGDIDFREFETLSPEIINEIEEYNMQTRSVTIYSDDVEIVDGKVVPQSEK